MQLDQSLRHGDEQRQVRARVRVWVVDEGRGALLWTRVATIGGLRVSGMSGAEGRVERKRGGTEGLYRAKERLKTQNWSGSKAACR